MGDKPTNVKEQVFAAINLGDLDELKALWRKKRGQDGFNKMAKNSKGENLLQIAVNAEEVNLELVKYLVKQEVPINDLYNEENILDVIVRRSSEIPVEIIRNSIVADSQEFKVVREFLFCVLHDKFKGSEREMKRYIDSTNAVNIAAANAKDYRVLVSLRKMGAKFNVSILQAVFSAERVSNDMLGTIFDIIVQKSERASARRVGHLVAGLKEAEVCIDGEFAEEKLEKFANFKKEIFRAFGLSLEKEYGLEGEIQVSTESDDEEVSEPKPWSDSETETSSSIDESIKSEDTLEEKEKLKSSTSLNQNPNIEKPAPIITFSNIVMAAIMAVFCALAYYKVDVVKNFCEKVMEKASSMLVR